VFNYLAEHENLEPLFGAKIKRLSDGEDGTRNGPGSAREMRLGPLLQVRRDDDRSRPQRADPLPDHEGLTVARPRGRHALHADR
jgi:hypothetical protein